MKRSIATAMILASISQCTGTPQKPESYNPDRAAITAKRKEERKEHLGGKRQFAEDLFIDSLLEQTAPLVNSALQSAEVTYIPEEDVPLAGAVILSYNGINDSLKVSFQGEFTTVIDGDTSRFLGSASITGTQGHLRYSLEDTPSYQMHSRFNDDAIRIQGKWDGQIVDISFLTREGLLQDQLIQKSPEYCNPRCTGEERMQDLGWYEGIGFVHLRDREMRDTAGEALIPLAEQIVETTQHAAQTWHKRVGEDHFDQEMRDLFFEIDKEDSKEGEEPQVYRL